MRVRFDTRDAERNFARGVEVMAKLSGFDSRKIIMAEAGSILKTCASRTKVAPASKIRDGARLRALKALGLTRGDVTINAGIRAPFGRVWARGETGHWNLLMGDNFSKFPHHVNDRLWAKVSAKIVDAKKIIPKVAKQAAASAALARGSWVRIADTLGIKLEAVPGGGSIGAGAIAKARNARARGGVEKNNGASQVESNAKRFFVTLINRLPYGKKIGLDGLLAVTVSNRAKYMYQSIEKGFRGSLEEVAKRFPGWVVKGGSN
jgi:hypothetical protein